MGARLTKLTHVLILAMLCGRRRGLRLVHVWPNMSSVLCLRTSRLALAACNIDVGTTAYPSFMAQLHLNRCQSPEESCEFDTEPSARAMKWFPSCKVSRLLRSYFSKVSTKTIIMDSLRHGSRHIERGRRCRPPLPSPDNRDKSEHHHSHGKPLYNPVRGRHQPPRGYQHISGCLSSEGLISEAHLQTISSHHQRQTSVIRLCRL